MKKLKNVFKSIAKNTRNDLQKKYIFDKYSFIRDVSFTAKRNFNKEKHRKPKQHLVINWIIPNIGIGGGGHLNIFRFIQYFQSHGHKNRIYIIGDTVAKKENGILNFINEHYLDLGDVDCYRGSVNLEISDISFATSWESAYYVYYDDNTNLKAYFIQDYEPFFYPLSSDYVFAEMTYDFGFYHLCASRWLAKKLIKDGFGSYFDLGVDLSSYKINNEIQRNQNQIFVYLRSNTPRRATEIILIALKNLVELNNNVEIVFAGEENITIDIPFQYRNLGIIHPDELPRIYNQSTIALVGSLTNYSLLPQELMASGCLVVDINLENNRMVHKDGTIVLAGPSPFDLAENINYYLNNPTERQIIIDNALDYTKELDWSLILDRVEENLMKEFT